MCRDVDTVSLVERLANQRISRHDSSKPADVVARLGAIQAQDYGASKWALGLRIGPGATDAIVERALAEGNILRTHAFRFTWQLVSAPDVRWILSLVASRLFTRLGKRHRELGLDAATFRRSSKVIEKVLADGVHRTRHEIAIALDRARISPAGQRLAHLLGHAELDGLICSGARSKKQSTYALLDSRVPVETKPMTRDEALVELTRRYFRSRGPATVADFTWWSGLAPADVRAGLSAVESTLIAEVIDGQTYYGGDPTPRRVAVRRGPISRKSAESVHLLPPFDEYLVAYRDRSAMLDERHAKRVNAGGGMLDPCVVIDGKVMGTWRRTLSRTSVAVEVRPFARWTEGQMEAVRVAASRYGTFLGLEASCRRVSWSGSTTDP